MTNMRDLLIKTLGVQSYSYDTGRMEAYILGFAERLGLSPIYDDGNIYITKGDAETYPCIVSHTDSVHKIIPDNAFTIIANNEYAIGFNRDLMLPSGCGGDDKVGIAICLQALIDFDNIKVAFFRDEEVGCIGSGFANVDWFNDCRFVLQCDRRGNADFIQDIYGVELQSKAFKKDVKKILKRYGYAPTSGALTDVYTLKELGVNTSVANISCGYYNPHDDNEIVVFEDVFNCYALVCDIIGSMTRTYPHKSEPKRTYKDWYDGYGYGGWSQRSTINTKDAEQCNCCFDSVKPDDIVFNQDYGEYICVNCNKWLEDEMNNADKFLTHK